MMNFFCGTNKVVTVLEEEEYVQRHLPGYIDALAQFTTGGTFKCTAKRNADGSLNSYGYVKITENDEHIVLIEFNVFVKIMDEHLSRPFVLRKYNECVDMYFVLGLNKTLL